jgi:hypothetical protein
VTNSKDAELITSLDFPLSCNNGRSRCLPKLGQVVTLFVGSLILMVGADFGAANVLPTLLPAGLVQPVALVLVFGTLLLCSWAVANAAGKPEVGLALLEQEGWRVDAALAAGLLTVPGLGGAYLTGSAVSSGLGGGVPGWLVGFGVGLGALGSILFTAWTASDPDPVLWRMLGRARGAAHRC